MWDVLIGVEGKPLLFLRIPGDGQALYAPAIEFDQVLLQGAEAEGMRDLELFQIAAGSFRFDHEVRAFTKEASRASVVGEAGIIEVSEHGFGGCRFHRSIMVGSVPPVGLLLVTFGAGRSADITRSRLVIICIATDDQSHGEGRENAA